MKEADPGAQTPMKEENGTKAETEGKPTKEEIQGDMTTSPEKGRTDTTGTIDGEANRLDQ